MRMPSVENRAFLYMPTNVHQSYENAEKFLRIKGYTVLAKNGIRILDKLTAEEKVYIDSKILE